MMRDAAQTIAKHLKDRRIIGIAKARRGLDQRIKHPLQIEGRPTDDLQNFRRGRLLFQRFLQFALAGLLGLKQPRVLDSDHRLICEGLEQLNFFVRERSWLGARHYDGAKRSSIPQHGNKETASHADRAAEGMVPVLRINLDIWDVNSRALNDRPACPEISSGTRWEFSLYLREGLGGVVVVRDMMEQLAVEPIHPTEESVAEPHRALDDRVEDRLDVCPCLADDAQDFGCRSLALARSREVSLQVSDCWFAVVSCARH